MMTMFDIRLGGHPIVSSQQVKPIARERKPREQRFFVVDGQTASRASGFEILNGDKLVEGGAAAFLPPPGLPFRNYMERPVFLADEKRGRINRDLEIHAGFWFISGNMRSVLQAVDPEASSLIECDMQSPDGNRQAPRWLCEVVRVLDALDEVRSKVRVGVADDGSKYYRRGGDEKLVFDEAVVGASHIFRMKYCESRIICDEELRRACKSAGLNGISFVDPSK
jgi:Protein of unknown function (DUF1629)